MTIQASLNEIQAKIAAAAHGRRVELLAVSKTYGADAVRAVIAEGHWVFAENRVQEAAEKYPALRAEFPDLRLHLIGPLQTNKVKDAVRLFDCIHTVDRAALAAKLANEMAKQGRHLPCFIQVNMGEEPQKAGVMMHELSALLEFCRAEAPLNVQGLMCIPPLDENPAPHFKLLAELAAAHQLPFLSMGMSGDFEVAIACGATHVRVGSALFGERV
jgi:pyridoxal phosphate enzyme (YggS family)